MTVIALQTGRSPHGGRKSVLFLYGIRLRRRRQRNLWEACMVEVSSTSAFGFAQPSDRIVGGTREMRAQQLYLTYFSKMSLYDGR